MDNKHPEIPDGPYCYTSKRKCPHWQPVEYTETDVVIRARCNLLEEEDKYPQDLKLLWDQVKLCGINDH